VSRLDRIRKRLDNARFVAKAFRSTGLGADLHPTRWPKLVRAARGAKLGPHVITMFHAANTPDREALVEYGEPGTAPRRLTWGELDAMINRTAHALVARGVTGGDRVALMLPNGIEYLVAQQALMRIGCTAVQIGYRLKAAEIAYILANAEPKATIVAAAFASAMAEARAEANVGGGVLVVGPLRPDEAIAGGEDYARAIAGEPGDAPPKVSGADGGGVMVYTSGTTGKPKGATRKFKQTGLDAVADMVQQVGMRHDDRHLCVCPLYHSAAPAFVQIMLSFGATVVLMNHFEPEAALALIQREQITCSMMVPTMLVRMCALPKPVRERYDTSSLRWIMSGAAPLSTETARQVGDQFGRVLWNFYGATETGLVTLAGPDDHVARPGTIGRKLRGNQIRLLAEDGTEAPVGAVGEFYARNSMLIAGYHKNADATSSAQKDGYFSVGDLARVDADGFYYLESRKHDMVISGGVNIYPREIEDHLNTHPSILEVAVVGVPDPEWGETLKAFVVLRQGMSITESELAEYCKAALADYKRPRKVAFLDELPRNPTGKVLKRELRDL
jgi:fatty-acyl-CoA synthase